MALSQKVSLVNKVLIANGTTIGAVRNYGIHFDMKFRALRRKKCEAHNIKPFGKSKEDRIKYFKYLGGVPSPLSRDLPFYVSSTSVIMDPYNPPVGDGSFSTLKKLAQPLNFTQTSSKNVLNTRQLKKFNSDFDAKTFSHTAKEIYINAHKALARFDLNELEKYTTSRAYNIMLKNCEDKTIKWDYLESLDIPTTVQVRVQALSQKTNVFAQVTVRLHSKQMLAIYDRFGRLMYGSEILAKDVLEYAIFEKHLSNVYGTWKLHDKIIPDWANQRDPIPKTYKEIPEESEDELINKELRERGLLETMDVRELEENKGK